MPDIIGRISKDSNDLLCSTIAPGWIHADNIGMYTHWKMFRPNRPHKFTLIFGPLPKTCNSFTMPEDIPEPGGYFIPNIKHNKLDLNHLEMY
jgi:hypothetical protein